MATQGMYPHQPSERNKFKMISSLQNMGFSLFLGIYIISATAFMLFDASTFKVYAEAFFGWNTALLCLIGHLLSTMKSSTTFRLMRDFEKVIESRKIITKYRTVNKSLKRSIPLQRSMIQFQKNSIMKQIKKLNYLRELCIHF